MYSNIQIFICEECTLVFQVYGPKRRKGYCCPNCGDNVAVVPYKAERYSSSPAKIRWSQEELEVLDQCIKGKLETYQAAIILGRSANAVVKKLNRMKRSKKETVQI